MTEERKAEKELFPTEKSYLDGGAPREQKVSDSHRFTSKIYSVLEKQNKGEKAASLSPFVNAAACLSLSLSFSASSSAPKLAPQRTTAASKWAT